MEMILGILHTVVLSKMRVFILLCLLGAAHGAAQPDGSNGPTKQKMQRIVGGEKTPIEQYPYMSNMEYSWLGNIWIQWCGGSLITPTAVLSAAHCYVGDSASNWRVRLGSHLVDEGGSIHPASRLILHADYRGSTLDYDVAVIRLRTPAIPSAKIGFARIPGTSYALRDGSSVYAVGWGSLFSGGPAPIDLQHVEINVINQELCAERYAYLKTLPGFATWPDVTDRMLCAGILDVGGKDACQGDSGGPLAHDGDIIVGITSWGRGCADAFYPGVNARVSALSDWIVSNALSVN